MPRPAVIALLACAACASSAPYSVQSAILNSAIAVGAAAQQRAEGGCYASCPPGTACNPVTGYCERAAQLCLGSEADGPRCSPGTEASMSAQQRGGDATPRTVPFGVSPATGSVPTLPPTKATPDAP